MLERMETLECYCHSFDIDPTLTKKILETLKYKWSVYNSLNEQVRQQHGDGGMRSFVIKLLSGIIILSPLQLYLHADK